MSLGDFMKYMQVLRLKMPSSPSTPGIVPGAPATLWLSEGDAVTVKGAPGATGVVQRYNNVGTLLQTYIIGPNSSTQIGAFAGTHRIVITCTAGSIDATVGDAVLGALQVASDGTGPSWTGKLARTLMTIGDSIANQGAHLPHTPVARATQDLYPTLTIMNANGLFIGPVEAAPGITQGSGTIRYYSADSTVTWQAPSDTEGPRVTITSAKCMYVFESGSAGNSIYVGIIPAFKPSADASAAVSISGSNARKLRNNCGTYGFVSWMALLSAAPFDASYSYTIPGIKAVDWWAARADWINLYTDETIVQPATNDCGSIAGADAALAANENIIKARQAIGSIVTLIGVRPYTGAPAATLSAMAYYNQQARALARRLRCDFVDSYPYLADPVGSGGYLSKFTHDNLHPSSLGGYVEGAKAALPLVGKRWRNTDQRTFAGVAYNATTAPYGNLLTNGQLRGVGGTKGTAKITGDIPDSHGVYVDSGSIATCVCTAPESASPIPRPDGKPGNVFRMTINNTGGVQGEAIRIRPNNYVAKSNIAVGEYFVWEAEVWISGTGIHSLEAGGELDGALAVACSQCPAGSQYSLQNMQGDTAYLQLRSPVCRLDTNTNGLVWGIVAIAQANGIFTVDVAQTVSMHKVPAP